MLLPFNSPIDSPTDTGGTGELTKYDIEEELLKDDDPEIIDLPKPKIDDKVDDDEDDKEDKPKTEEVDELEELEKELKGPTDEQLELMTPARRKDILTAFPELFKKFPYLETAYYRDQKFTEYFPTFKDAESAAASAKEYSELQEKLKTGDFEDVINLVRTDEQAFARLVDNYLPTLAKIDRQAYDHILGNTIRHTIKAMVGEADRSQSAALKTAATILNQFVFGSSNFEEPRSLSVSPEQNRGQTELEARERQFEERRFNVAQNDIAEKVNNSIKATIANNIDPKNTMTDYVKNAAVNAAMTNVEQLIMKDTRFRTIIDKLWQEAARNDYNKASMDKIKSACVSKARTVLEPVIKSARNEALKGMNKRVKDDDDKEEPRDKRERRIPNNSDRDKGSSKVPAGMTSLDYLNSGDD